MESWKDFLRYLLITFLGADNFTKVFPWSLSHTDKYPQFMIFHPGMKVKMLEPVVMFVELKRRRNMDKNSCRCYTVQCTPGWENHGFSKSIR